MKKTFATLVILCITWSGMSQINTNAGIDQAYRDIMVQSHSQFTKGVTDDFLSKGGDKRFFFQSWLVGGATNNFNSTISGNYYFNYDFVAQELYAKWKDTAIIVNTNYVKSFFLLNANQTHTFVKCPPIDEQGKYFFESLAYADGKPETQVVQLLKLRKTKVVKAKKDSYLANFSGDFSDTYDNDISYYLVFPDKTFKKVKLNKKSFASALPATYASKAQPILKELKEVDEASATALVQSLNQ